MNYATTPVAPCRKAVWSTVPFGAAVALCGVYDVPRLCFDDSDICNVSLFWGAVRLPAFLVCHYEAGMRAS